MSKSDRKQRQAIDIAYNIVLARIAVPTLQPRFCALIRCKIGEILSKGSAELIMESQAARRFDTLDRDRQLLVLSTVFAGIPKVVIPDQEWTTIDNPLSLKIDSLDIQRARLLFFQWRSLAKPESNALHYLYEHWQIAVVSDGPSTSSISPRLATGHA